MKKVLLNFTLIIIFSALLFFILSINASLDTSYILILLTIVIIHTSLIISFLLKKEK